MPKKSVTYLQTIKAKLSTLKPQKFNFRVKSSDSIFFLLGLSPFVNLFYIRSKALNSFTWKILFNSLKNCKETTK